MSLTMPSSRYNTLQLSLYTREDKLSTSTHPGTYTIDNRLVPDQLCANIIKRGFGLTLHTNRYYTYRRISSHVMKSSVDKPSLVLTDWASFGNLVTEIDQVILQSNSLPKAQQKRTFMPHEITIVISGSSCSDAGWMINRGVGNLLAAIKRYLKTRGQHCGSIALMYVPLSWYLAGRVLMNKYKLICNICKELHFISTDEHSLERLALAHTSNHGPEHKIKVCPMKSSGYSSRYVT